MQVERVEAEQLDALRSEIVACYRAAWLPTRFRPEERAVSGFEQRLQEHLARPGFRLHVALDESKVIGFVYGFRSQPNTYWRDLVSTHLEPQARDHWLSDCFEFVELAVLPAFQGRRVGGALHDALLEGLTCRTACLTTYRAQESAVRLYLKRGWEVLADDVLFPGDPFPYLLMGRALAS